MMQAAEGNNGCARARGGRQSEGEHLTPMEAGESQRRFLQGCGEGAGDICQDGVWMRCTEGGASGTRSAFWKTFWGAVVSVDD